MENEIISELMNTINLETHEQHQEQNNQNEEINKINISDIKTNININEQEIDTKQFLVNQTTIKQAKEEQNFAEEDKKEEEKVIESKDNNISSIHQKDKKDETKDNIIIKKEENIFSISDLKEEEDKDKNNINININTNINSNTNTNNSNKDVPISISEINNVEQKENKEEFIFNITPNKKTEESKNSEIDNRDDFKLINMNIPENLKVKNNEEKHLYLISKDYFTPLTLSCCFKSKFKNTGNRKVNEKEFSQSLIKIADVSNVDEFWEVFQHIKKPNRCKVGTDYHIFKQGIRPMWEDSNNRGKFSVLLTWDYSNYIWEEVIFSFAKGLFPYFECVNGLVLSVRQKFHILSFWVKSIPPRNMEIMRNTFHNFIQTPSVNCFDYFHFE